MVIDIVSFDGNSLDSASFKGLLYEQDSVRARQQALTMVRPLGKPLRFVRSAPTAAKFDVHVSILSGTLNTQQDVLAGYFDVSPIANASSRALIVNFEGANRSLDCYVERIVPHASANEFVATLVAPDSNWHSTTQITQVDTVASSGDTWTLANAGLTAERAAKFRIRPTVAKTAGQRFKREIIIAWRSTEPAENYAIDVTNGGIDHAALVTATKAQADGDDLRLLVDGVEVSRFIGEHANNDANSTLTTVWANFNFSAARTAKLLNAITGASPANGASLEVEPGGTLGWPTSGAILNGAECILYNGIEEQGDKALFKSVTRAARNTTAETGAAAEVMYGIEHRVQLLYGNAALTAPDPHPETKPLLDLTAATPAGVSNVIHRWIDFADTSNAGRSMGWQRRLRNDADDNRQSRILAPSGAPDAVMNFEYQADGAVAGKPNFNEWFRAFPCPIDDAGTDITFTRVVDRSMALVARGVDLEGNETKLATYSGSLTSASASISPAADLYRLGFHARSQVAVAPTSMTATNGEDALTSSDSTTAKQLFTTPGTGTISKMFAILRANAAVNAEMGLFADDGSNDLDTTQLLSALGQTVMVIGADTLYEFDVGDLKVQGGIKIWTNVNESVNTFWDYFNSPLEGGTSRLSGTEFTYKTYNFKVISADMVSADGVEAEDAAVVTVDTVICNLDSALTPSIVFGAEEAVFVFEASVFSNDTTAQTLTLTNLVADDEDDIEIDIANRTIKNLMEPVADQNLSATATWSDVTEGIRVAPGTNTFSFTETTMDANGVIVDSDIYSKWSA